VKRIKAICDDPLFNDSFDDSFDDETNWSEPRMMFN
jgi:hypothetical protein